MASEKVQRLERIASSLQERFGAGVLHRADGLPDPDVACISTQFPALDRVLGIRGIPRQRISEIVGVPTCGLNTLALKIIASAQVQGGSGPTGTVGGVAANIAGIRHADPIGMAVFMDPDKTFDVEYAARCGVQLDRILVVRPANVQLGLDTARDLAASGGVGVLVYDLGMVGGLSVTSATSRLLVVLSGSPCAFLFLAARQRGDPAVSPYSSLRLGMEKERWLHRRADVRGLRARVSVLKNKLAPPGRPVSITIGFERDEL